jgi:predicted dehydrogenase
MTEDSRLPAGKDHGLNYCRNNNIMKQRLKIIQIGIGGWGWSWIGVAQQSTAWELRGVVDLNKEALEKARSVYGLRPDQTFTSLKDALKDTQIDAALIIVPPQFHAPVAEEALAHGLHCLIEKPLAGSVSDAHKIVSAGQKAQRKLMVSQNYRFKRAAQTLKKVLQSGFIGEVGSVYVNFQKAPRFTGFRLEMDEPLLTDMAIHHFDQMRGIVGLEPVRISARSWNPNWSWFSSNAVASVLVEMSNQATAAYTGSWVSQGWETTWDGDWRIQGTEGEIHWANNEVVIRPTDLFKTVFMSGAVERNGTLQPDLVPMQAEERWAVLLEFAAAILEDREPETSATDNLKSMAMVLGASMSAKRSGEPIRIDDVLSAAK